ncbi:MAG: MiaB/RimO family radical SAM methylthiotransferase, partial [bacterium]|nr:MiaB/RimO family radical SAM methylthiotransferase [bacterium]
EQVTNRSFDSYESYEYVHEAKDNLFKSYLPIQTGCNFNCTYCIVPAVKGREINHSPEKLHSKVDSLVKSGVREVTLLGQTINSYRWEKTRFADLLESLALRYPDTWFRFLTSHPVLFDLRIIDVMSRYDNLCPFIHIPAQSGSDKILKSMKRGYTVSKYLDLIATIRTKIPKVCISTDMICGFPGETEDDFNDSLDLMKKVRFETAFMFFYSERKNTVATAMLDSVPMEIRKKRLQQMIDLQMDLQSTIYQERLGDTVEVLVEGRARRGKDFLKARSTGNFPVFFEGGSDLVGTIQKVRLIHSSSHSFKAELVEREAINNV